MFLVILNVNYRIPKNNLDESFFLCFKMITNLSSKKNFNHLIFGQFCIEIRLPPFQTCDLNNCKS